MEPRLTLLLLGGAEQEEEEEVTEVTDLEAWASGESDRWIEGIRDNG